MLSHPGPRKSRFIFIPKQLPQNVWDVLFLYLKAPGLIPWLGRQLRWDHGPRMHWLAQGHPQLLGHSHLRPSQWPCGLDSTSAGPDFSLGLPSVVPRAPALESLGLLTLPDLQERARDPAGACVTTGWIPRFPLTLRTAKLTLQSSRSGAVLSLNPGAGTC